jgi:hypothetical protein
MKALALTLALSVTSAHASYYATRCSDATGAVRWESGHNTNTITFKKLQGGELVLALKHIRIDLSNEQTLELNETNVCGFYEKIHVFTSKAKITPSAQDPRDLTSLSENNEIETLVICRFEMNSRMVC